MRTIGFFGWCALFWIIVGVAAWSADRLFPPLPPLTAEQFDVEVSKLGASFQIVCMNHAVRAPPTDRQKLIKQCLTTD